MSPDRPGWTAHDFARDDIGGGSHAIDLDGNVQAFAPDVAAALYERSLLYLDGSGVWHLRWHGFPDLHAAAPMGYLSVCDFCGAQPVAWTIPCADFPLPGVPGAPEAHSAGDWAACQTCGDLVARGQREAFLTHCVQRYQARHAPDTPRAVRRALMKFQAQLHERFWKHYRGGARPERPRPVGH